MDERRWAPALSTAPVKHPTARSVSANLRMPIVVATRSFSDRSTWELPSPDESIVGLDDFADELESALPEYSGRCVRSRQRMRAHELHRIRVERVGDESAS